MSTLIERIIARSKDRDCWFTESQEDQIRWVLLDLANELDADEDHHELNSTALCGMAAARWIREKATE